MPRSVRLGSSRAGGSARGLDWLNFFLANVQTGFGPFISAYLASQAWTQGQIGLALSIGTITTMAVQVPAGALVDATRDKRRLALFAVVAVAVSALTLAAFPQRLPVWLAEVLHGVAGCLLGPVIAVLSLAVAQAGGVEFGERLGRNARFASVGAGCAAGLMGGVGYWVSEQAVLVLAAALVLPAVLALLAVRVDGSGTSVDRAERGMLGALLDRRLLLFALCCAAFSAANAAMFPLAAVEVTRQTGSVGELVIAASLIVPQFLVAALSPMVGRAAERWGRRPVLLLGFAAVPLRGALFAVWTMPAPVVAIQALDGISGAVFGVLLPLVVADISRQGGRFNLSMGAMGLAIAGAAAFSTEAAGLVADRYGTPGAFAALAVAGIVAFLLLWLLLPETGTPHAPVSA